MPTTDQDARGLAHFARRLRDETQGAGKWDEAGTIAATSKLVGQNLALSIERVIRHAADPKALTPAAIHRPWVPDAPAGERLGPSPPRTDEVCPGECGLHVSRCICDMPVDDGDDDPTPRPPRPRGQRSTDRAADYSGRAAEARAAMRGEGSAK